MIDFDKRVKSLCKEKGITQKEVAAKLGITDVAFTALLKRGNPHLATVESVAAIFGMSLMEFMQESESSTQGIEKVPYFVCPHCGKEVGLFARSL